MREVNDLMARNSADMLVPNISKESVREFLIAEGVGASLGR